jgi:signal-transduction protein with cAMP-binding, CBS, and nucleotidyltransferase domain
VSRDLALQLLSGMYSGLPVIDGKGKMLDVTEFDLLNAIRNGRDLQTIKAADIMTQPAICVREDEDLDGVITKMTEKNIICVPVVGEEGKLVGVIARADVLSRMIEPEFVTVVGNESSCRGVIPGAPSRQPADDCDLLVPSDNRTQAYKGGKQWLPTSC